MSGDICRSIVRHGYDGIDQRAFQLLVRVQIAGNRYLGWVQIPRVTTYNNVTEMTDYRQPA